MSRSLCHSWWLIERHEWSAVDWEWTLKDTGQRDLLFSKLSCKLRPQEWRDSLHDVKVMRQTFRAPCLPLCMIPLLGINPAFACRASWMVFPTQSTKHPTDQRNMLNESLTIYERRRAKRLFLFHSREIVLQKERCWRIRSNMTQKLKHEKESLLSILSCRSLRVPFVVKFLKLLPFASHVEKSSETKGRHLFREKFLRKRKAGGLLKKDFVFFLFFLLWIGKYEQRVTALTEESSLRSIEKPFPLEPQ